MKKYDYKAIADRYDKEVKEYDSYGHDVIFGMCYEFVKPGDKLLDIGIGTGLASIQFFKAGLKIYGIDSSSEMLNACRSKLFAEELKLHDISGKKLPYKDRTFNHVICCGVLHFLKDLTNIFSEIKRIMKKDGLFAFTIATLETKQDYIEEMTLWNTPIFKHSNSYIKKLLEVNRMEILKQQKLLIKGYDKINYNMLFTVIVCKYLGKK